MTFKDILATLWLRRWIIILVTALAVVGAAIYIERSTPEYSSTAALRNSSILASGQLEAAFSPVAIELEPDLISSPDVLKAAAEVTGEEPTALYGAVTWTVEEGARRDTIYITAVAPDPLLAQQRASAVSEAFIATINTSVKDGTASLQTQLDDATAEATRLQRHVNANPDDLVAAGELARAIQASGALSSQISLITLSGSAYSLYTAPMPGARQGASPIITMLTAGVAGLIAGMGTALLWSQFDTRMRTGRDVEQAAGVPFIAELPWDRAVNRKKIPLPALSRARTPLNEGFRGLRTSLQVLDRNPGAAFVVTSVEPKDGKTFASANLAVTWARSGKSVILVGGDLRRPELAAYFGEAADGSGLAELLEGNLNDGTAVTPELVREALTETEIKGLRLLPSGSEPADPADLLASDALGTVIGELRSEADVVIIDSPPSLALTDTALLSKYASGTIVLARFGRTRRERLVETLEGLSSHGVNVFGVVGNRSRRKVPNSYDRYYTKSATSPDRQSHTQSATADAEEVAEPIESKANESNATTARRSSKPNRKGDDDLN